MAGINQGEYIMKKFPKIRPPLPDEFARIYAAHYKNNREGNTPASSLSRKMESWLHKRVADDVRSGTPRKDTLEIGAGTLNQLQYEPAVGQYDIVEPFHDLFSGSSLLHRITKIFSDISEIPGNRKYHRITSIAAFEHILNLPEVIARAGLLLGHGGSLRVSIPSEGTIPWMLGWKLTTGLEFRIRHGLDYGLLMKHEHVNTAKEIEGLLGYFFRDIEIKVFGLSRQFSLYQFFACSDPVTGRCLEYLSQ
jgi:hypothetical protein